MIQVTIKDKQAVLSVEEQAAFDEWFECWQDAAPRVYESELLDQLQQWGIIDAPEYDLGLTDALGFWYGGLLYWDSGYMLRCFVDELAGGHAYAFQAVPRDQWETASNAYNVYEYGNW